MNFNIFCILCILPTATLANFSWLTVVLVDFKLREECAEFWNTHNNCVNPSLRIIANLGERRFASSAWPISEHLNKQEKLFFTSQWSSPIDNILLTSQIEGENALNPFGLSPKCDHGFVSFVFGKTEKKSIKTDEQASILRVASIHSQCFTAKLLIKIEDNCPHCPKIVKRSEEEYSSAFFRQLEAVLRGYDYHYINAFLLIISVLSISIFVVMLNIVCCKRFNSRSPSPTTSSMTSCSSITPSASLSPEPSTAKLASIRKIPSIYSTYSEIPEFGTDNSAFDHQNETRSNITYGYRLTTQTIRKYNVNLPQIIYSNNSDKNFIINV